MNLPLENIKFIVVGFILSLINIEKQPQLSLCGLLPQFLSSVHVVGQAVTGVSCDIQVRRRATGKKCTAKSLLPLIQT